MPSTSLQTKRNTGWKRADKRSPGIYRSPLAKGYRWGYYDKQLGRIVQVQGGKEVALEAKAKADLRKRAGTPVPDTKSKLIRDLGEEVREIKRRKLSPSSLTDWERMLDLFLEELGHHRPSQLGPDRLARLIRDLEDGTLTGNPLAPATIRKDLAPLSAIFRLALRRGLVTVSPLTLLDEDERGPMAGGGVAEHYRWSPEEVSALIAASARLARKPEARYDYSPILHLIMLTGLRNGEARGLRWCDVDLIVRNEIHVRHSAPRVWKGKLSATKTEAGVRDVPLSPGLVELLIKLKPVDAEDHHFVFAARGKPDRPLGYWNLRGRGLTAALTEAGLEDKGITLHTLRSAAISLYASSGLTMLETADVMGQSDPHVTWKHYARLFDPTKVAERVRAAQESIELGEGAA